MGLGRFKDGKFDVLVSFDGMLTDDEWFAWERAFKKASELLFNATEGQGQFGRIYACDEAVGRATADYVVHVGSGTSTSGGRLGEPGSAINTFRLGTASQSNATHGVLMLVHELAHHVWDLGDERTGRWLTLTIDTGTTPADFTRIPLEPGQTDWDGTPLGSDTLLQPAPRQRRAVLRFAGGDGIERQRITTHDDQEITVNAAYPESPINDQDGVVSIDDQGECGNQSTDLALPVKVTRHMVC